jgi:hypothetical protein
MYAFTGNKRYTEKCVVDYGGEDLLKIDGMISFDFFVGGYSATSHYVHIDTNRKNKVIKYAKTPREVHVDLKRPMEELNLEADLTIKEIFLTSEEWDGFIGELINLGIDSWKDHYCESDTVGGIQWRLDIEMSSGDNINKSGRNEYPPCWRNFIKVMEKYVGEGVG